MKVFKSLATVAVVSALAPSLALAQMPETSGQADMQVTPATRQQLITSLSNEIRNSYVFPDIAKNVSAELLKRHQRGAYDNINSAKQLSATLTKDLQAMSKDRHLQVMYSAHAIPVNQVHSEPTSSEVASTLAMMRSNNFGVEKIERLPLNIGYLNLVGFAPAKEAAETLAAAMTVIAHTDALIIDMRDNFGGQAATSTLLASYLLDKRTHLGDFYYREGNRIEQRWSSDVVPGLHYGSKKDVYILTSRDTFSAGEDFTYALKNLRRATVVGETTGGGANAGDNKRLLPNFSAFIPLSRLINPVTRTNWEGIGVTPDISVCAADALRTAQVAILKRMANVEADPGKLSGLKDRIGELEKASSAGTDCP
ncbi:MAG: S41 family peptidase [Pseudomonadota bacterium]